MISIVFCACGCGQQREEFDKKGRLRKYIHGHGSKGKTHPEISLRQLGKHPSEETKKKISLNHADVSGENNPNFGNHKMAGKNNPNYIDGRYSKPHFCIEGCGREISYNNWQYGQGRCTYCSNIGERSSFWQGGISKLPYSQEWTEELKEKIRIRDHFGCQNCGMTEEEHLIVNGRILPVHHIDYNKENCKEDNLITLCVSCNSRANFNREYWTKFYQNKINLHLVLTK